MGCNIFITSRHYTHGTNCTQNNAIRSTNSNERRRTHMKPSISNTILITLRYNIDIL